MYFSINGIQNHITVIMWSCNFLIFKKNIILEKLRVNISYVFFLSHFSTFITYSTFKGRGVPRMWSLTTMVYTGYKINLVLYLCEHIHFHFSFSCIGEGNENPLQCSCLENPRDRGSLVGCRLWITQNRTRLKRLSSSSSSSSSTCV